MKTSDMARYLSALLVGACLTDGASADTQVFRLELTDNVPSIVGADGVKRQVVLVEPEQYAMLTGQVAQVWKSLNASKEGRQKLHGNIAETRIDETTLEKTDIYEDGFCHKTQMERKTTSNPFPVSKPAKKSATEEKPKHISDRHWQFLKQLREAKAKPAKTVTVEHNAATGKDEVQK